MRVIVVLKIVKEIVESLIPIWGWFKQRKAQKKAERLNKALTSIIIAVETYSKQEGVPIEKLGKTVKELIKEESVQGKINDFLNDAVQKIVKSK